LDRALRVGLRGLPGGSSLAELLNQRKGVRHHLARPSFTLDNILQWADSHEQRHGAWPTFGSGQILECPGETWAKVNKALACKLKGLPQNCPDSLAKLLHHCRKSRLMCELPALKVAKILKWADEHHQQTGLWPTKKSGPVYQAPNETWTAIDTALNRGRRSLPAGSSLAQLLGTHRGVKRAGNLSRLTEEQILEWADEYTKRTGSWPTPRSGVIQGTTERWKTIDRALRDGYRGLTGGNSLEKLQNKDRRS
jgi:hypothetical protein